MAQSLTHKYIPRKLQTEENLFIEEYYSSTDTKIYLDGEKQTEIGYISYSVQEQLLPIYGYQSYTFDDIAVGNRIITGAFKVPIKNKETQGANHYGDTVAAQAQIRSTGDDYVFTINDFNIKEEESITQEWPGTGQNTKPHSNNSSSSNDYNNELLNTNSEVYEYIQKLNFLGYDINSNFNADTYKQVLKDFQMEYSELEADGLLGADTKRKINEEIANTTYATANQMLTIKKDNTTHLYRSPNIPGAYVNKNEFLDKDDTLYVTQTFELNGEQWMYVVKKNTGLAGFVKASEL